MVVGELTQERDLVIIGGGPGGYHAAIRAAQLGLQVTLIERQELGGVCLNEGCIPSKVHTSAAQAFHQLNSMKNLGIETTTATFKLSSLQKYKQDTIRQLKQGVEALCKANKVEVIKGEATFISSEKVGVESGHQYDTYSFKQAIIATGCKKKALVDLKNNHLTQTTIWNLEELPSHLILFGNDDITLEIAFSFRSLGSEVTMIFPDDQSEFAFDASINKELTRQLKKQKVKVVKSCRILQAQILENGWELKLENGDETTQIISGSHLYVSAQNVPDHEHLGLGRAGIEWNQDGFIKTDDTCQTNIPNIYAIGDITEGPSLAVKAIKQGKVAAENIAGMTSIFDLNFLPRVVHSIPPIACAGLTEVEALEKGYEVKVGETSLKSSGYASILGQKDGLVKTISEKNTDVLLGVHIMGVGALELISTSTLALEMVAREEDLLFPLYPHPSINESFLEAVEDLNSQAVHKAPSSKRQKVSVN